jgi:hypothetical protein
VLGAAIGWFTLGVLAIAGDASAPVARALTIWKPTGPLSGVTTGAIVLWLVVWLALARLWRGRDVDMRLIGWASAALVLAGLFLTFQPSMDFLQGR